MADAKITQLTELTDPALVDLFAIVDDPSGSPSTKKVSLDTLSAIFNKGSMARQALINGNFDVWQRGTTYNSGYTDNVIYFLADRWSDVANDDGGTKPTLTRSMQAQTAGALYGSYYFSRLNTNGAGTSLGVNSFHRMMQKIEHGTRNLCGLNKTVTVSFYAKSDIANKKIGIYGIQDYGSGGSPTSLEALNGTNWTLTSSWAKYSYTFTTNTLAGKTFGTANDDALWILIYYVWGSSEAVKVGAGTTAETYVGSGNIDIAQVQLCAGDVALPFQPKSFEEELRACQRYYEKSYDYEIAVPTNTNSSGLCMLKTASNTIAIGERYGGIRYKVSKRIAANPVIYPYTTATNTTCVSRADSGSDLSTNSGTISYVGKDGFTVLNNTGGTLTTGSLAVIFHFSVEAEL